MRLARDYDVAILVSRDTDLLPAIETVIELGIAHVEVATWTGASRLRLPGTNAPWCHSLTHDDYKTVEDPTDYTAPKT